MILRDCLFKLIAIINVFLLYPAHNFKPSVAIIPLINKNINHYFPDENAGDRRRLLCAWQNQQSPYLSKY